MFQTHFRLSLFIITRVYLPESALGEAGEKKRKRKKRKNKKALDTQIHKSEEQAFALEGMGQGANLGVLNSAVMPDDVSMNGDWDYSHGLWPLVDKALTLVFAVFRILQRGYHS